MKKRKIFRGLNKVDELEIFNKLKIGIASDEKIREFAKNTMLDDMKRMEYLPRKYV